MSIYEVYKNQIFYEKDVEFKITPKICEKCKPELDDHLRQIYCEEIIKKCFYWSINYENSTIVVDESMECTVNNIYQQLSIIACWLFENGFKILGSFCYRIGNVIEFISMNDQDTTITHYVMVDTDRLENFFASSKGTVDCASALDNSNDITIIGNNIITDAVEKMTKYNEEKNTFKKSNNISFPLVRIKSDSSSSSDEEINYRHFFMNTY